MELLPVDTANKKVFIRNSKGEYEESYDGKALGLGTLFPCTIDTDNI